MLQGKGGEGKNFWKRWDYPRLGDCSDRTKARTEMGTDDILPLDPISLGLCEDMLTNTFLPLPHPMEQI